uniref:Uncharacterized protein n=1 Tax=viral metagenome TaxID=1070528 RepID=A0A6M3LA37_9ZZZZ
MNFYAGIGLGFAVCMIFIIVMFGVVSFESKATKIARVKHDEFADDLKLFWSVSIRQKDEEVKQLTRIAEALEKGVSQ